MIVIHEGYQVKPHKLHPKTYIVVVDGKGGKIPAVLDGLFTSVGVASKAIDEYVENRKSNGKKSNEAVTES